MKLDKIKTYFGFAVKSGKAIWGSDQILKSKSSVSLILISRDLPLKTAEKLKPKGENIITMTRDDMTFVTGKDFVKACAVTNENLAKAILEETNKCQE